MIPMWQRKRQNRHTRDRDDDAGFQNTRGELRFSRTRLHHERWIEDVGELGGELRHRVARAVRGKDRGLTNRQRTQVVDAVHVIGMGMGEEHGIDPVDSRRHQLQAQLGRRVDQQARVARLDERRGSGPAIAWIRGGAGGTVTADLRHAE